MIPNAPPAFRQPACGAPPLGVKYAIPSMRNARSRLRNNEKNATVDRRVAIRRTKVKMNQP